MSDNEDADPDDDWMDGGEGTTSDDGGSGGGSDGGWNPDDTEVEGAFEGDGATGGAADVVETPGEVLTEEYWFEGEQSVSTPQGTALLWALSGAGLYASSFIFAAVGLQFAASQSAETFIDLMSQTVSTFISIPMVAFIAAGVAIELYVWRIGEDLPETTVPLSLLIPVVLHVSLFFVESVPIAGSEATLAGLFAQDQVLSQLLLWPPVITGTIYAVVAYRAILDDNDRDQSDSLFEFA